MISSIEPLLRAIDDAIDDIGTLEADSLAPSELHDVAIALQRARDRLGAAAAPVLDRWQHCGVWALDGSKTAAARLARETRCAGWSAKAELRRARALATMPVTSAAALAGELSLDQVDVLASANTTERRDLFAEHEQTLVDSVRPLRHRETSRTVRYWCQRADAELDIDDTTPQQQRDASMVSMATTLDGTLAINGQLDPVSGVIVHNEVGRLAEQIRLDDLHNGVERTPGQRRAAAMVEMARRSATAPADGRAPKPLFTVLVGDKTLEYLCELANGTIITPGHLAPFITDAMIETVLFDGPSTVVSVSKRRTFIGALRRAIEVRDRHCQHPSGCDVPAEQCDVDHIVPHSQGGPTSQSNGRIQCPTHNRDANKHDHGAVPHPERTITKLDEIRARLRWRLLREPSVDEEDDPDKPVELSDTG